MQQNVKWKLRNLNPTPPKIKGLIKLHKTNAPIRPIISSCNSPLYHLGKYVTRFLDNVLALSYSFNVKNSVQLISDLTKLPIDNHTRLCSFDISNMYTNIPTHEVSNLIQSILIKQDVPLDSVGQIRSLVEICIGQNYFQHECQFFKQTQGLAMGAPYYCQKFIYNF
jgi:hypothetical protein